MKRIKKTTSVKRHVALARALEAREADRSRKVHPTTAKGTRMMGSQPRPLRSNVPGGNGIAKWPNSPKNRQRGKHKAR